MPPPLPSLQDLPAASARTCLAVSRFVHQDLGLNLHSQTLLLAISGGGDSLALLCMLLLLRPQWGCVPHVLHLDHQLRPESANEARMVAEYCEAWRVPCVVHSVDVAGYAARQNTGLEEAGREVRYTLLEEERRRLDAAWIATGHHREDLEEDVLLRLLRGAGWPALGGMPALDPQRRLLRPLLWTAPQDLRGLLRVCHVAWAEDASNADLAYKRNRIRHRILPLLREENPSLHQSMHTLWHLSRADAAHWENLLDAALEAHPLEKDASGIRLPSALLQHLDSSGRLRLYMRVLRLWHARTGRGQARAERLFRLDDAWVSGQGGAFFQFSGGVRAEVLRGRKGIRFGDLG